MNREGPICIRIQGHLGGLLKSRLSIPLETHIANHAIKTILRDAVTILSLEPETIARETLEACWVAAKALKKWTEKMSVLQSSTNQPCIRIVANFPTSECCYCTL